MGAHYLRYLVGGGTQPLNHRHNRPGGLGTIQQSERVKNGRRKREGEGDLRLGRKRVNMGISETCACGESIHV